MSLPVSEQDGEDPGESTSDNGTVHKRPRSSPTLLTPQRHLKRVPLRELVVSDCAREDGTVTSLVPRTLTYETEGGFSDGPVKPKEQWSVNELKALTEFVLFHTSGESWPSHKQDAFWKCASEFVKSRGGAENVVRSGRC